MKAAWGIFTMKWSFFKKGKGRKHWFAAAGRRTTGVITGVPAYLKLPLKIVVGLIVLLSSVVSMRVALTRYYFNTPQFILNNPREDVTITTGKTLTPSLVYELLGVQQGASLFSVPIDRKRHELMTLAPHVRDIKIERYLPNKMTVSITERDPIARIGVELNGQVVDEEGMAFIRYVDTDGLPLIKRPRAVPDLKPGERLYGMERAAVRLIHGMAQSGCKLRLREIDAGSKDYLLLTFAGSNVRKAKFAWAGMADDQEHDQKEMLKRLDILEKVMNSEIGKDCRMFDATTSRPTATY